MRRKNIQVVGAWKITIISGSPFVDKAGTQDVGLIELTVPVR